MWQRVRRILRAEVASVRKNLADAVRRTRRAERYDPPAAPPEETPAAADDGPPPADVRRAFAALELPLTATAAEIARACRRLMSRYHPDRHAADPERELLATELSRRLTEARDRALAWRRRRPTSSP